MGNGNSLVNSWVSSCGPDGLFEEPEDLRVRPNKPQAAVSETATAPDEGKMKLKVALATIERSHGLKANPFGLETELAVTKIQKAPGWGALTWRQDRFAKDPAGKLLPGLEESRWGRAQNFWVAKVETPDGKDFCCLLQVGATKADRDIEKVKQVIQDIADVASYAHRFNLHTARSEGEDVSNVPCVLVAAPVGCFVIDSTMTEVAGPGEAIALTFFPCASISKFIFEGGEDFLELPHSFFHYVVWASGGKEMVGDLQGVQDDKDIVLIDPVMIRLPPIGVGDVIGMLADPDASESKPTPMEQRFNAWHPRCAQLCRTFDPQRRSIHVKRACGVALPTCGVGH